MKYLGVDYGAKHTGLAISDSAGKVAMPYAIISNDDQFRTTIFEIIQNEHIDHVVVGESKDNYGGHNYIQTDIDKFVGWLEAEKGIRVTLMNEQFSSRQAKWGTEHPIRFNPRNHNRRSLNKKQKRIDDKAATIVLQSYLDSQLA